MCGSSVVPTNHTAIKRGTSLLFSMLWHSRLTAACHHLSTPPPQNLSCIPVHRLPPLGIDGWSLANDWLREEHVIRFWSMDEKSSGIHLSNVFVLRGGSEMGGVHFLCSRYRHVYKWHLNCCSHLVNKITNFRWSGLWGQQKQKNERNL